jgi:hypothetical protein
MHPSASTAGGGVEGIYMRKLTYFEKLKDPRWQRKRLDILNRSNFSCEDCHDKTSTLHVHHCIYHKGAEPWEYQDDELRALCAPCHELRGLSEQNAVAALRWHMAGLTASEINDFAGEMLDMISVAQKFKIKITDIPAKAQ